MDAEICPICKRELRPAPRGPFKIACWPTHKMARLSDYDFIRRTPQRIGDEIIAPNPLAFPLWEIECPNSGQPLD